MSRPEVRTPGEVGTNGRALSEEDGRIVSRAEIERKRFSTLQARAALAGVTMHRLDGDDGKPIYIASRWNLTRELRTLDDVAAWLGQAVGVR